MVKVLLALALVATVRSEGAVDLFDRFRPGWEERWMARKLGGGSTEYAVVDDGGRLALAAVSHGTASALSRKLDAVRVRRISWRWKVERSLSPNGRERERAGDDYAARVLVVFGSRAICYVWAAEEARGATYPNPYARSVRTIVLQSGDARSGRWVREERDVASDYRRVFGSAAERATAVALVVDTDDTGKYARAWFADLRLGEE
jgi:hypothetical protein